jgi:hypothetical protein
MAQCSDSLMVLDKVTMEQQVANVLTKALQAQAFIMHQVAMLGTEAQVSHSRGLGWRKQIRQRTGS